MLIIHFVLHSVFMFRPIQVICPYAYGQPIRVLAAHMRMGYPYAYGLPIRVRVTHMRMGQNSCFAHMRISAHMRIGMLDHTSIATAMTYGYLQ